MYGLYTPVLLFQAFCVYHAYRKNADQRWYWLILLVPLIGSVIYLYYNLSDPATIKSLREGLKEVVVSNYRIEQLEKALAFSESHTNRVNLADAYVDVGRYKDAIPLYHACLQGFMVDDPPIRIKLLSAYFMNDQYAEAVKMGDELESLREFREAEQRLAYAWALFHLGEPERADQVFQDMDRSFTNYLQRFEYCKFLVRTEKQDTAKAKLSELLAEFEQMQDSERRHSRSSQRDVRALYEDLMRPA